jgi:DNA polymerase III subunit delta'
MKNYSLYGNQEVWHNLVNDSLTNQVAHTYIFAGPAGIGKATTAKEYIKYLSNANEALAKRIDNGNFLDLLTITKLDKDEISIDTIRSAQDFFRQTPAEGKYKFIIIDSADDLNLNSANALLKILEEPTANTYLFLISHNPHALLATIKSRSRMIRFKPLSAQDLNFITNISTDILEDFVAGSASRAIMLNEENIFEVYNKLLEFLKNDDILYFDKLANQIIKSQWSLVTNILEYMLCRLIKISSSCQINLIPIEQESLVNVAQNKTIDQWFKVQDEILDYIAQTKIFNLDKKQILLLSLDKIRKSLHN